MYLLYSLLLTLGFIILLPRFVLDALRSGKYVTGLRERLGNIPQLNSKDGPVIWLHCVSVGEARAAQSIVAALKERFPVFKLVISTTTVTGQQVARDIFGEQAAAVLYFPIDWAWTVRRTLRAIKPAMVLIMETELWPRLFQECRRTTIPIALINGRISDKSFRRYKLVPSFIRRVLNDLSFASMQSHQDAERIRELGMDDKRVSVSGNLKFDSAHAARDSDSTSEMANRFRFDPKRPLIVAASTHAPEEALVLYAFRQTKLSRPAARLLLAPRHPERFEEVAGLIARSGLTWARRTNSPSSNDADCDVILLDTIGELNAVFSHAEIVFVGGSITPHGGHNVLEPAARGACAITGPHTQNFAAITRAMLAENALIQLPAAPDPAAELSSAMTQLLSDEKLRREIGERARLVCERNRGATARTIELISQVLRLPALSDPAIPFSVLHVPATK